MDKIVRIKTIIGGRSILIFSVVVLMLSAIFLIFSISFVLEGVVMGMVVLVSLE